MTKPNKLIDWLAFPVLVIGVLLYIIFTDTDLDIKDVMGDDQGEL